MTEEQRQRLHHAVEVSRYTLKTLIDNAIIYSSRLDNILDGIKQRDDAMINDNFVDAPVESASLKEVTDVFIASQFVLFDIALVSLDGDASDQLEECIRSYAVKVNLFKV